MRLILNLENTQLIWRFAALNYCDAYDYVTYINLQAELLVGLNIMPWRHKEDVKVKVYGKWFRRSL